eukprot:3686703-Pyramimonas_sp.AAC.1
MHSRRWTEAQALAKWKEDMANPDISKLRESGRPEIAVQDPLKLTGAETIAHQKLTQMKDEGAPSSLTPEERRRRRRKRRRMEEEVSRRRRRAEDEEEE